MRRRERTSWAGLVVSALAMSLLLPGPGSGEDVARVLVVTNTQGYRHESIPLLVALVEKLGREKDGWLVERADTDAELAAATTAEALKRYRGVAFVNSSGDVPLADRRALLEWLEAGGGLVGVHGAANTLQGWPEFVAALGGEFDYHKDQAKVSVRVDDPAHPATRGLHSPFELFDEIYLYKSFDRSRVHVLLSMDRHPNTGEPGFFPLAWTREPGLGRVFYTGIGHRDDVVQSPWFADHLRGGLRWALKED